MKNAQKKYKYYTPVSLAKVLLQLIPETKVSSIIDICCGSWNLLSAASEKYPNARITGVDIDRNAFAYRISGSEFLSDDGRDFALERLLGNETYDLILSNPPFGVLPKENRRFTKTVEPSKYYSGLIGCRYECEMVQANLLLAHNGSILMFILPNTFVFGETLRKARCQIASDFNVRSIIRLPHDTFGVGRINTFAIIMTKGYNEMLNPLQLYNATYINNNWIIEKQGIIEYEQALDGIWWKNSGNSVQTQVHNLHRGTISSDVFTNVGSKILHCASKKSCKWKPSIRYYDAQKVSKEVLYAKQGDVIINRIGKGAGYWCVNMYGRIPVSDCIIVISDVSDAIIKMLKNSSDVSGRLNVPLRGVATPYITTHDIQNLLRTNEEPL